MFVRHRQGAQSAASDAPSWSAHACLEKRIRTLVVEDSADYARYLCAFLEALPKVDVIAKARSGRDAVMLAHEWMPDLVLMDVRMPEMTGLEAASQLARELPGHAFV